MDSYVVRLAVDIENADALYTAALERMAEAGYTDPDAVNEELMADGEVDVRACLQWVFEPGEDPAGTCVTGCDAEAGE